MPAPVNVIAHVPPLSAVIVTVHVGPAALVAENAAIGEAPPQVFVCEIVAVEPACVTVIGLVPLAASIETLAVESCSGAAVGVGDGAGVGAGALTAAA